jgi:aspartokinase
MIVAKFGGTSVGSAENIERVIEIAKGKKHKAAMVVSALAGMTKIASKHCQILMATQSTRFVDEFKPDNILIVERNAEQRCSEFKTVDREKLADWLEEYSMSELWEKNVIGGQGYKHESISVEIMLH